MQNTRSTILDYSGGVNTGATFGTMPSNQLVSAIDVSLQGTSLVQRGGPFKIPTPVSGGTNITSVYYWNGPTDTEWFIFCGRDNTNAAQIYQMVNDSSTTTATKISSSNVNDNMLFESLNGILILGQAQMFKWTGTGNIAALGTSWTSLNVNCQALKVVNNFLFMAGAASIASLASNIYWSNVADPTTYSGNFLPFRLNDGDFITALSSIGTDLVIFKRRSTGILSTQTQVLAGVTTLGPLTTVSEGIGCVGPRAVDHLPDGRIIMWAYNGHAYIFDGSNFLDISDQKYPGPNVQSILNTMVNNIGQVPSVLFVDVYPVRHEVWFMAPYSQGNTFIMIYDYLNNAWYQKQNYQTSNTNGITTLETVISQGFKFNNLINTLSGIYNYGYALLTGDINGNLWLEDCTGNVDQAGNSTVQVELSIPIPADFSPNLQRFFIIPFKTASAGITITYYIGINGTYGSSQTFTSTGGWDRLQIALLSNSSVTSQQVKITVVGQFISNGIIFDPAYVAEQVVQ